jgi:RNA polymerase sigma-70 factor (ECF subfamily)
LTSDTLKSLFLAYRREIQAYLTSKLRDSETAADLTQETFLRYAEQSGTSVNNDRSYLYRTARNLAIDHIRERQRRQTDPTPAEEMAEIVEERPAPDQQAADRERLERLRQAMLELPERTRQVFVLNRIDGLTYAEVADRLDISDSSVQKHLSRALHHAILRMKQ